MTANQLLLIGVGNGLYVMSGLPIIVSWKSSKRPKNAKRGTFGFNSQTNSLECFNGSNWFAATMGRA